MLSIEEKRMKLNILRHKQKLLELLENINDTTIKPRIKFDPSEIDKLLSTDVKPEPKPEPEPEPEPEETDVITIKEESEEEVLDSTDDFISVGSSDGWNNASLPITVTEIDTRRKSSRLEAASHYTYTPSVMQEDHMYALDHIEEKSINHNNNQSRSKRKSRRPSVDLDESPPPKHKNSNTQYSSRSKRKSRRTSYGYDESPSPPPRTRPRSRYRGDMDRDRHNAKERECRQQIAEMFIELRNACSKMETKRRIPSKQFILSTAKNECIALTSCQKKLIAEKKKLIAENESLKKKCNMLKMDRIIF